MKQRLYKLLRQGGYISTRKEGEVLLEKEKILIDGIPAKTLNYFIDISKKRLEIDKKLYSSKLKKLYLMINKPKGYLTSKGEFDKGKNVFSLITDDDNIADGLKNSLFPVGRLDKDTEGLLILTNDGDFAHQILRPEHHVKKSYLVRARDRIVDDDIENLKKGISIRLEKDGIVSGYVTKPCEIVRLDEKNIRMTISEGKKRQVRRMIKAVGNEVIDLKRISIGKLRLDNLETGKYRVITHEEAVSVFN